jgi:N-acetylneuraminate synthase
MTKTFIIAEAGVNHNGSINLAKELIDAAVEARADAIKFQTFRADKLLTATAPKASYQTVRTPVAESQYEMLKKLELSQQDHAILIDYCRQKNIQFLSTPFDLASVDLLTKTFDLSRLKLASGEITNAPLLLKAARTGKPIILSTGMSMLGDIEMALSILAFGYLNNEETKPSQAQFIDAYRSQDGQQTLQQRVTLLHCTTEYPAAFSEVNLKAIDTLRFAFNLPVGYSDHTVGVEVPIAAVARGATMIEKHFTLNRNLPGPDHQASLEPGELIKMINAIRHIEMAIGDGNKIPSPNEFKNRAIARKSLVALCNINKGEVFTENNLGLKRPGNGIPGIHFWKWLGKVSQHDYSENDLIAEYE